MVFLSRNPFCITSVLGERKVLVSLCAGLMLMLASSVAYGQMGGIDTDPGDPGTGGKNQIQGTIYYPGGRRLDVRAKVRLRSLVGAEQFTLADENGAFTFRRLQGGSYVITVDAGNMFEMASERVDIIEPARRRHDPGMVLTVQINLQPKQHLPKPVGTIAVIPDEAVKLYNEALELVKKGDNKKAIEQLNAALKIFPDYFAALNELGVQHMRLKEFNKAEGYFKNATKLAPDAFTPRLNYGVLLVQMKNYPKAVDELYKALQKNAASAIGHLYIGRALVNLGSYDDAEKFLQLAVKYGNDKDELAETHRYLGAVYIERQQHQKAADELEKYLSLSPDAKDAHKISDIIKQLRASGK
ncbi:MAG: tetratricopeptide repeat protein [Acidobacteriota bacterium]